MLKPLSGEMEQKLPLFTAEQLNKFFENSYDGILVSDAEGTIIFGTPSAALCMGVKLEELVGKNVKDLVNEGRYNQSIILKAIEQRQQQSGVVSVAADGNRVFSTATPIFDEHGAISMVITNVRTDSIMEKYIQELDQIKTKNKRYRSALKYLSHLNVGTNAVIAESPKMISILNYLDRISGTSSTVLLLGESGTGKEVLSRYIHEKSNRSSEPFIPVNCAAIPKDLLESEFYGYEKGAFTGALTTGKSGFFEMADHGTLFLDEIAELPLDMQSKLLRSIELGEFQRVGGTMVIKTDVRIIAATNQNLEEMVEKGLFRKDLFYRLNVIPILIPPLRERKDDILALSKYFLNLQLSDEESEAVLNSGLSDFLLNYDWPGNIRELKNVIERVSIDYSIGEQSLERLIEILSYKPQTSPDQSIGNKVVSADREIEDLSMVENLKTHMDKLEKRYLLAVLKQCNWNIVNAAKKLEIHRSLLYRKMQALEIKKEI
ncbi:sigma-54 interaction domain-containing protein [Acidaminobacter sp.]|uniref:sigma-54 interaction domain-containing protein n=1 Tax=Acidaminobacter sp. TaxID=1872102 RepID=UPI00256E588D|nr:sigma 54-interacting transcriptional regulator [Acidaminobacter sp.]MDK9711141.1 sigma 54-interacting transcriptional regulator [Acidaminobacter sp.]